ncbi:MAG TPA: aminotransferase class V-fold PLP-dependent enzyme [Kofleriaceae bacterium]
MALESGNRLSERAVANVRKTIDALAALGVREIAVVDGHHAEALRARLNLHELPQVYVRVLANLSWKNLSGSAVLHARAWVEAADTCLVVRGDRPFDAEALAQLAASDVGPGAADAAIVLATCDAIEPGTDVRVKLSAADDGAEPVVTDLGEDLDDADGIFTGCALVGRSILDELAALPNPTLEHALLALAQRGKVLAVRSASWTWAARRPIEVEDKVAALLETKKHAHYVLLNPGPVNTTATVKSALVHHDICHRDSAFSELMVSLTGKLRRIFRGTPHHTVVALTGSGTSAMESAIVSTVPSGKKILVVDNGAFGARLAEVAGVHEMDIVHLRYDWGREIDPADITAALAQFPDIAVVAMIHHETSVGLLNPVREIGAICRAHDVLLIVDAVSSLGAEDLDVVRDNIDICYGSANKCLHAVSGAAFMCVAPRVWPRIENLKVRSYYLDLKRYRRYMDELAQTPFTPAVSTYFALDAACGEFLADGHAARLETYAHRNARLRRGLGQLGMHPFTSTGNESHSIVTCTLPAHVAFDALYEAVKARGIILYGCKGVLADKYMQIANMGELPDETIDRFLGVLAEEIERLRPRTQTAVSSALPQIRRAG